MKQKINIQKKIIIKTKICFLAKTNKIDNPQEKIIKRKRKKYRKLV